MLKIALTQHTYIFCSSYNVISFPKISQMSSKKKNHKFRSNVNLILILASSLSFYFIYMLYTKMNTKEICNNKLQDNIISVNVLHHKTIKKNSFPFSVKKSYNIFSLIKLFFKKLSKLLLAYNSFSFLIIYILNIL